MAVRNFDSIKRHGDMVRNQVANERKMREENFHKRVGIIKAYQQDAIDCVDTILALFKNGLRQQYEDWESKQTDGINFDYQWQSLDCGCPENKDATVSYVPKTNIIKFGWSAHGMYECYQDNQHLDYLIHTAMPGRYDGGLTRMATKLKPFLDAFFAWVETI